MPQIKQIFLDCDNTTVLSEDLAFEACAEVVNEILVEHRVRDRYTGEQLIMEFIGQTFRGVMAALRDKYGLTVTPEQIEHYAEQEESAAIAKLQAKACPCQGSMEVLEQLCNEKKYGLAIVSSSALRRIRVSIEKTRQDKFFPYDRVYSAATSLDPPTTKPNPAVYHHAMRSIGVEPGECIAVEDSKSGALAAICAGVPCIAYVGSYSTKWKRDQVAHTLVELGCKAVMYHWNEFFDCIKKIEEN